MKLLFSAAVLAALVAGGLAAPAGTRVEHLADPAIATVEIHNDIHAGAVFQNDHPTH
jgi:hypothetical protein